VAFHIELTEGAPLPSGNPEQKFDTQKAMDPLKRAVFSFLANESKSLGE
jgi:hypothetical protein